MIVQTKPIEYNPFEATTADLNLRRTTGFKTPDLPVFHSPPSLPLSLPSQATSSVAASSVPIPILSRSVSTTTSNLTGSLTGGVSPATKRKRNFKLGSKIDAWWSSVRTSFSVNGEEDRDRIRRELGGGGIGPTLSIPPLASRNSHQAFVRPSLAPSKTSLRSVASAQDLSPRQRSSSPNTTGASAVAVTAPRRSLAPDDKVSPKTDSRRRNPNLSLNLGPNFHAMRPHDAPLTAPITAVGFDGDVAPTASNRFLSPNYPTSSVSHAAPGLGFTPGFEPSGFTPSPAGLLTPPAWARTPAFVEQSEAIFPVLTRPKSAREAKSSALSAFSMNTVRQHIKLRLATAKENCDKELAKVVLGITAHVETELQRAAEAPDAPFDDGTFGELVSEGEGFGGAFEMDSESEALEGADETLQTDSEGGTSRPPSRSRSQAAPSPNEGSTHSPSSPKKMRTDSPRRISLAPRSRHLTSLPRQNDFLSSYTITKGDPHSAPDTPSASSSRSNSRSRSPLPPQIVRNLSATGSGSPARSSVSHLPFSGDLAQSAFIVLLQDIIMVATEILDTTIVTLTSRSGACAEYIQRVQQIGKAWDENPELSCRGWYVQLLLAVAGLSRVVEWWEAEKGFWTFDDTDEADAEPIVFIAKPAIITPANLLKSPSPNEGAEFSASTKYSPLGIDLGTAESEVDDAPTPVVVQDTIQKDADDLRHTVEQVRSQTLLMELSLDGQLFQYLSSAWEELVGSVSLLISHR